MNLAVTGLSMITSVGRDAATACASIRAGLSRPRPIHDFELIDPETLEPVPLVGHPLHGFAEGFNMVGLWMRLAKHCVRDLIDNGGLPGPADAAYWDKTALIAVTPCITDDRFMSTGHEKPDLITSAFLTPLVQRLGLAIAPGNLHPVCSGQGGTASAVALADQLLNAAGVTRALVLAVDSYLDSFSLEWLAQQGRLKSPANPVGLMPGEAGACFLLEGGAAAQARGACVLAVVEGIGAAKETNDFFSAANNRGVALAAAVVQALRSAHTAAFTGELISDHNGEEWRAAELAGARLLLHGQLSPAAPVTFPAAAIGDVGAASGAIGVGVAVRAFVRNYAAAERSLVLCSSDHGEVGAILMRRAA